MIVFAAVVTVLTTFWLFCLSDENTRTDLKKLPTLPTKVLKEHPSLAYWYVTLNLDLINTVMLIKACGMLLQTMISRAETGLSLFALNGLGMPSLTFY